MIFNEKLILKIMYVVGKEQIPIIRCERAISNKNYSFAFKSS